MKNVPVFTDTLKHVEDLAILIILNVGREAKVGVNGAGPRFTLYVL